MEKDIILAALASSVGLGGILLVFVGFIYSKAETYQSVPKQRKYRIVAKLGTIPFLFSLACGWLCLRWLETASLSAYGWAIWSFKISLGLTAIFGVASILLIL